MAARDGSLLSFLVRRLLITIPLLVLISLLVFGLIYLVPGNPAVTLAGGGHATQAQIDHVQQQLHLNEPFVSQFGRWLWGLLHGDLGTSLFQHQSVAAGIASRLPVTLSIAIGGMAVAIMIGIPLGVAAGLRPRSLADRLVTVESSLGQAIPDFWLAMLLVVVLSVNLHLLAPVGYVQFTSSPWGWFQHLIMPWLALGVGGAATLTRQVRGSVIETMRQDYMRTAVAKGLSPVNVIGKHAMKNALSPVVIVAGIQFGYLIRGTFIIEQIFSLPGLGTYMIQAIDTKDIPVIQGVALVTAVIFVVLNLTVDVIQGVLNPRVRLG